MKAKLPKGIPPLHIGLLASEEQAAGARKAHAEELYRRMEWLADSFAIPHDGFRWYTLAFYLARQHVPELKDAKPIGAPQKWGDYELGVLAVEIEREQERQGGGTVERAAASLAKRQPWKAFLQKKGGTYYGPDPTAALIKVYSTAKKSKAARLCRKAFKYHAHPTVNTVQEWDAQVLEIKALSKK